jgi:hypothetical protein
VQCKDQSPLWRLVTNNSSHSAELPKPDFEKKPMAQLFIDYGDLAGRTYSTSITLDLWNRTFYDVQLIEGASTHHGDAVYPQPGLRDASPKRRQPIRTRTKNAWRELK